MNGNTHTNTHTHKTTKPESMHAPNTLNIFGRWIYFVILIWRDDFTIDTWTYFLSLLCALRFHFAHISSFQNKSLYPPSSTTIWFCVLLITPLPLKWIVILAFMCGLFHAAIVVPACVMCTMLCTQCNIQCTHEHTHTHTHAHQIEPFRFTLFFVIITSCFRMFI